MRIVLDTGILISSLITRNTPPDMLFQAWHKGMYTLITSDVQLQEIERVLSYPKLKRFIQPKEAAILLNGLHRMAHVLEKVPEVSLSPDPDDNKILATAIAGQVDYLVSGDKRDLLALKTVKAIPIVTARWMAEKLNLIED